MVTVRRRVWTKGSVALASTGLLLVLVGTVWLIVLRTRGAEIAGVLALPMAVVGTAVALSGWLRRPGASDAAVLSAAAGSLSREVAAAESAARQRLLGDTGDLRAADVGFAQPSGVSLRWRTDGGAAEGSVQAIAGYYRSLRRGRLMVLGDGGAGKTVLATQLTVDLADRDPADGAPVPVRVSLPAFLPDRLVELTAAQARQRLDEWIADRLVTAYGLRRPVARELAAQGRVLPILDGLDEMDPDDAD